VIDRCLPAHDSDGARKNGSEELADLQVEINEEKVESWTSVGRELRFSDSLPRIRVDGAHGVPTTRRSSKKRTALLTEVKDVFRRTNRSQWIGSCR